MAENRNRELERFSNRSAEELSDEELAKRYAELLKKNGETRTEIEDFEKQDKN